MKKILIICFVAVTAIAHAQEKPFRLGVKLGVPNVLGLNVEYATPLLGNKLAPSVDLSYFSLGVGDAEASFSYLELGANYYFFKEGRGLYGNLGYGRIGFKGTYNDAVHGEGEGKLGINLLNVKVGAKLGGGFYFRPEIGYAVGIGNSKVKVEYDNTGVTQEEDIPGFLAGGIIVNIGFGVAF